MPVIREYTTQVSSNADIPVRRAQPNSRSFDGARAGIGLGNAITRLGTNTIRIGTVLEREKAKQEVTNGHADFIQAQVDITNLRRDMLNEADPDDDTLVENYIEQVDQRIQSLSGNYTSPQAKQLFNKKAAELKGTATIEMSNSQAALKGVAARLKVEGAANNLRSIVHGDPSLYKQKELELEEMINDKNGMLAKMPAEARLELIIKMKQDLALSAVEGTMMSLPEQGIEQVENGDWDKLLDADKRKEMIKLGESTILARGVEERRKREEQHKLFERSRDASRDEHMSNFVESLIDPNAQFNLTDVITDPNVRGSDKFNMINAVDRFTRQQKEVQLDVDDMREMIRRIELPFDDPNKLTDKNEILNKMGVTLTPQAYGQLSALMDEVNTPEGQALATTRSDFFKSIKPQIDKSNPLQGDIDRTGGQRLFEFMNFARRKEKILKNLGVDPHELYDPASKHYLGTPETKFKFQSTVQETMERSQEIISRQRTKTPDELPADLKKRPDESTAEWRKRMEAKGLL